MASTAGENEETKKQKQKALIEAAFKVVPKVPNDDSVLENGDDCNENCEDGKKWFPWYKRLKQVNTCCVQLKSNSARRYIADGFE